MSLWGWMTRNVFENGYEVGLNMGYLIGKDEAISYLAELAASDDFTEDEQRLLEAIAGDLLGSDE